MSPWTISRRMLVLAEKLHFGRAAERLHVSQPALSKRIRRMEDRSEGRCWSAAIATCG